MGSSMILSGVDMLGLYIGFTFKPLCLSMGPSGETISVTFNPWSDSVNVTRRSYLHLN